MALCIEFSGSKFCMHESKLDVSSLSSTTLQSVGIAVRWWSPLALRREFVRTRSRTDHEDALMCAITDSIPRRVCSRMEKKECVR